MTTVCANERIMQEEAAFMFATGTNRGRFVLPGENRFNSEEDSTRSAPRA